VVGQPVKFGIEIRGGGADGRRQAAAGAQGVEQGVAQRGVVKEAMQVGAPDPAVGRNRAVLDGFAKPAVACQAEERPG